MDLKTVLKANLDASHGAMEVAVRDCAPETLTHRFPGSTINSIGAIYAHTVFGEDGFVNGLVRGQTPVYYAGGWAEKIGLEMPKGGQEEDAVVDYNLDTFRQYAAAVYAATSDYLTSVSDAELDKLVDPGFAPPMPVSRFMAEIIGWHIATHQGEISALKGAQGLNGLDFSH
jgi:DinB superfamily